MALRKPFWKNYFFEPQIQMQYSKVSKADYTTSQGTNVTLDAIDSLIARAGMRLGFNIGKTFEAYVKSDIYREFLGDQDVYAQDKTGVFSQTYENDGTWYDAGLGLSATLGKNAYVFTDVEKLFGNDNDNSYQFNVGFKLNF